MFISCKTWSNQYPQRFISPQNVIFLANGKSTSCGIKNQLQNATLRAKSEGQRAWSLWIQNKSQWYLQSTKATDVFKRPKLFLPSHEAIEKNVSLVSRNSLQHTRKKKVHDSNSKWHEGSSPLTKWQARIFCLLVKF